MEIVIGILKSYKFNLDSCNNKLLKDPDLGVKIFIFLCWFYFNLLENRCLTLRATVALSEKKYHTYLLLYVET